MIVKEIVAQIKYQGKKGANIRLVLKVGKLIIKNNNFDWQPFKDEETMSRT